MWQIPPYQTKPVMKANFVARMESNHTAYIRIKTNTTGAEFLYLPLEVEVTSQPGIYSPQEVIDFGLVPSQSETKAVKLLVLNSGAKPIQIQNVIATPVTEAISINFKAVKVQPETLRPKVIAEMVFNRKFLIISIWHCLLKLITVLGGKFKFRESHKNKATILRKFVQRVPALRGFWDLKKNAVMGLSRVPY